MGLKKVSRITGCLLAALIIVAILCIDIMPAIAASSSLPEGAYLGSELRLRNPFMGAFLGGPWAYMDDMEPGYGGMMWPGSMNPWMMQSGSMNPWMMQGMDQFQ